MNAAALVRAIVAAALVAIFWSAAPTSAFSQQPRVELELATEPGFPTELARTWIESLNKAGIEGVRIRGGTVADDLHIEPTGTRQSPGYRVTGILTMDGNLLLPGGKFTSRDVTGLSRWRAKLQEGGSEGLTAKPAAFGLLPAQLVATHEALSEKVSFSTQGGAPREVVEKLARIIALETRIEASALAALEECDPIGDELQGLSQGTALAAAVRPAGLVVVPTKAGGKVELLITDNSSAKESWPIGWPTERTHKEVLPDLMKFIPVEINDVPLGDALSAITGRLKVPVVIDYNALARKKVDLAETKVSLPKMRNFYGKILSRLLSPVGLKYELRLDEADQPFLWITALGNSSAAAKLRPRVAAGVSPPKTSNNRQAARRRHRDRCRRCAAGVIGASIRRADARRYMRSPLRGCASCSDPLDQFAAGFYHATLAVRTKRNACPPRIGHAAEPALLPMVRIPPRHFVAAQVGFGNRSQAAWPSENSQVGDPVPSSSRCSAT